MSVTVACSGSSPRRPLRRSGRRHRGVAREMKRQSERERERQERRGFGLRREYLSPDAT